MLFFICSQQLDYKMFSFSCLFCLKFLLASLCRFEAQKIGACYLCKFDNLLKSPCKQTWNLHIVSLGFLLTLELLASSWQDPTRTDMLRLWGKEGWETVLQRQLPSWPQQMWASVTKHLGVPSGPVTWPEAGKTALWVIWQLPSRLRKLEKLSAKEWQSAGSLVWLLLWEQLCRRNYLGRRKHKN